MITIRKGSMHIKSYAESLRNREGYNYSGIMRNRFSQNDSCKIQQIKFKYPLPLASEIIPSVAILANPVFWTANPRVRELLIVVSR